MKGEKSLDNQDLKERIDAILRKDGEITAGQAIEIVRPFFIYDPEKSYESELRRKVQSLISGFKDVDGQRTCFSDNNGLYILIDTTTNLVAVKRVRRQLQRKYDGTNRSLRKVERREKALMEGQMSLSDLK